MILDNMIGVKRSKITLGASIPAAVTELLAGSRFNQNGFNGYTGSNGTDTDSNSRISSFNETGAGITKVRAYFANWYATGTNETDAYNAISVSASIEYPAGTFSQLLFAGSPVGSIANGALGETDELTLGTAIPANAQFWIRTYVSVPLGSKWPQGYLISTGAGEAADFSTLADKTVSGTITNTTASAVRRGFGPIGVKAVGFTGTPFGRAYAGVGDSIMNGATDVLDSVAIGRGNQGYVGKAMSSRYPYINLGISGTKAADNLPVNFSRRQNLLQKIGITHVIANWSVNDIGAGASAATIRTRVETIAAGLKAAMPAVKIVWTTATPRTSSTDSWKTVANQTVFASPAGGYTGGTASVRSQYNAMLRAGVANIDYVFDAADAGETSRDSGIWRAGEGSTHLTNTGANSDAMCSDGQHPTAFSTTAPGLGGIYVLRDAVVAALPGWL